MKGLSIRKATASDAERLNQALEKLSTDLGDKHRASAEDLVRHGFEENPAFFALIAEKDASSEVIGALIASPMFSTSLGGAGLYVSDLWISKEARGNGLGKRLLGAAVTEASINWTVKFLKLTVHNHNAKARRFYERLGFRNLSDETVLALKGEALETLRIHS
jgi:ribosomal protein S18 acetylase RimI-like enzyme